MNKLYLSFAAAFLAAGAMVTTEAQETVERVKTALDFKKAAMSQSNKAPKIGGGDTCVGSYGHTSLV